MLQHINFFLRNKGQSMTHMAAAWVAAVGAAGLIATAMKRAQMAQIDKTHEYMNTQFLPDIDRKQFEPDYHYAKKTTTTTGNENLAIATDDYTYTDKGTSADQAGSVVETLPVQ